MRLFIFIYLFISSFLLTIGQNKTSTNQDKLRVGLSIHTSTNRAKPLAWTYFRGERLSYISPAIVLGIKKHDLLIQYDIYDVSRFRELYSSWNPRGFSSLYHYAFWSKGKFQLKSTVGFSILEFYAEPSAGLTNITKSNIFHSGHINKARNPAAGVAIEYSRKRLAGNFNIGYGRTWIKRYNKGVNRFESSRFGYLFINWGLTYWIIK